MKHRFIKRILALLAASAVAVSALCTSTLAEISYESYNWSNAVHKVGCNWRARNEGFIGTSLEFSSKTVSLARAKDPQTITLSAKSTTGDKFNDVKIHVTLDKDLELTPIDDTVVIHPESRGVVCEEDKSINGFLLTVDSTREFTAPEEGMELCSFNVKIKDPKPGKKYPISITYLDGDKFHLKGNEDKKNWTMDSYTFSHIVMGYVTVKGNLDDDEYSYADLYMTDGTAEAANYEGASLELTRTTISLEEAAEPQIITLSAKGNNIEFDSTGLHITVDDGMELVPIEVFGDEEVAESMISGSLNMAIKDGTNSLFMTTSDTDANIADPEGKALWRFKVQIKDPKPGKRYPINIWYMDGDIFTARATENYEEMQDYAFTHVKNGYIQIEGELEDESSEEEEISSSVEEVSSAVDESSTAEELSSTVEEISSKVDESSKVEEISRKSEESSSKPDSSKPENESNNSTGHQGGKESGNDSMTEEKWLLGDVNNDKKIDIEDAVMIINNINGVKVLSSDEILRADVDSNKTIDIEDAVAIISHVNGVNAISGYVKIPK